MDWSSAYGRKGGSAVLDLAKKKRVKEIRDEKHGEKDNYYFAGSCNDNHGPSWKWD